MRQFYSLTIVQKAIAGVLLVLLPSLAIFYYNMVTIKNSICQIVLDDLKIIAEAFEGHVYQFIEMSRRRLADFASDGFICDKLKEINAGETQAVDSLCDYLVHRKILRFACGWQRKN
jgi:hypothetical protein